MLFRSVFRAGATTIAELAMLKKAVVLVPFEKLPGNHQMKNAEKLAKKGAIELIPDSQMVKQPEILLDKLRTLIRSPKKREDLSNRIYIESKANAAERLAEIILENSGVNAGR